MKEIFGECHAHIIMDGVNYKEAISIHKDSINDMVIREHLKAYQKLGITFVRDGGDALGVSRRARSLAAEYGIDYRTPVFAIHKNGHYGAIVGKGFDDMKEYYNLVKTAKKQGADFIKIMTTGLLDFNNHGQVTGTPLEQKEVLEMVHVAHEEGMAVMSHTNGIYGVQAAVEAGVDSVEHGNYIDEETIKINSLINVSGSQCLYKEENNKIINNSIDLIPIIWQNIILEVPLKVVSPDIEVKNINGDGWRFITDEEVVEKEIDPRLEKLKEFLGE